MLLEYRKQCDGIERDLHHAQESIVKWYVHNFCFREPRLSKRWVMHHKGVGNVFVEMFIAGTLQLQLYKCTHKRLFMGSEYCKKSLDIYGTAILALQHGPLSMGQNPAPSQDGESAASSETELAQSLQAWGEELALNALHSFSQSGSSTKDAANGVLPCGCATPSIECHRQQR